MSGTEHDAATVENEKIADCKDSATVASVHRAEDDLLPEGSLDPVYQAKAHVLNRAIQDIGMGKYQWQLFVVTGFGWLADNLWPIVTGLIFTPVVNEFQLGKHGPFLKLGQNIGLLVGAFAWGIGSDVWGRRLSFNVTLLITGVFALAAGGAPSFASLTTFVSLWSVGVGGNLPVDSAIFLEFIPGSHQWLLTVLSVWWAFGQLLGSLIAWPLLANFSCEQTATTCTRSENMGWRYFLFAMGGLMLLMWGIRFFVFKLYESPKYLMGRGQDQQAVDVVHFVAEKNGRPDSTNLSVEDLRSLDRSTISSGAPLDTSAAAAIQRRMQAFSTSHVKSLFATRQMAWSTSLLIIIWALIGLAFPLYNAFVTFFLASRGADFGDGSVYITYRNQVILSVIGVPGAILAGWFVELPYIGRRGTLSIFTILTGVFLFASTTARTSDALLGWNCGYSFTSNVMYGVLYAISPEIFPTKDRGTGNGIVATANRIFGIMAPIIALYADLTTSAPIFISGAIFIVAGFIALLIPFEPRGKASL